MSAAPLLGHMPQKKEQVSLGHRNWLHVAKLCGEVSLECLGTVHAFPELQWGTVCRKFRETLTLGQSNIASSLKERQVAVLLRPESNPEAFCSTPSKLWFSGAYWWVCMILWVRYKSISALCSVFQMGPLYFRNLRKPQVREIWWLVEIVYLNAVVTVWSLRDLIPVHNETWGVNWAFLEHMGL